MLMPSANTAQTSLFSYHFALTWGGSKVWIVLPSLVTRTTTPSGFNAMGLAS